MHSLKEHPRREHRVFPEIRFTTSRKSFLGVLAGPRFSVFIGALLSVPTAFVSRLSRSFVERLTSSVRPVGLCQLNFASCHGTGNTHHQIEQSTGGEKRSHERAVYITKDACWQSRVLSSVCPHLGCTVPWNKERNQFVCPCHGGTFHSDGTRVSGPSLRGMDALWRHQFRMANSSVRFQYFRQLVS